MIISPIRINKNNTKIKAVELKTISKKYNLVKGIDPDFRNFWALKDVHVDIYQGQITGIIGRNGAGKTTLLNIIAGILTPTEGEISVKGRALGLFNLGIGFQDELTGRENIFLNGAIIGATKKELSAKLDSIIEFSELGNFIDMPLGTYSQGMRLRLGFSIIANLDFDILVIDEVLAVGDTLFQSKCFERLMDFKRSGRTLVITSQDMGMIERLCDKVVLLDHGCILFEGEQVEGINNYRALLNKEKFFVGPPAQKLVENTKKWAEDISEWGKELGTREALIDSVEFINKFGWRCRKIRSGELLKIRVKFTIKNVIKNPHFGVAIFREDGVYCYGPNTVFDGYKIAELKSGKSWFALIFKRLLLAPGKYRISVAIWDKNEKIAFNYHTGYYRLIINGYKNEANELLNIFFKKRENVILDSYLLDKPENNINENKVVKIESIKFLDYLGQEKNIFVTNELVRCNINLKLVKEIGKYLYLWMGIYRDDNVYCQGITIPIKKRKSFCISFPKFRLLPGGYKVSLGAWDNLECKFLTYYHDIYSFKMVSMYQDHGTIYLEHKWQIGGAHEKRR